MPDVGVCYTFDIGGQWFDVGDDRYLDNRMLRIVCLKLVAGLNRTLLLRSVNLELDDANLTRLDDFLEVEVAGLASAGRGACCSGRSDKKSLTRAPNGSGDAWS